MVATVSLLPRLLAPIIREALTDTPVVCVVGPRQSGKTTLVQHLAPERAFFSLDENNYYQTAVLDPSGFVAALPDAATVDEVQRVPDCPAGRRSQTPYQARNNRRRTSIGGAAGGWRLSRTPDPSERPRPAMVSTVFARHH